MYKYKQKQNIINQMHIAGLAAGERGVNIIEMNSNGINSVEGIKSNQGGMEGVTQTNEGGTEGSGVTGGSNNIGSVVAAHEATPMGPVGQMGAIGPVPNVRPVTQTSGADLPNEDEQNDILPDYDDFAKTIGRFEQFGKNNENNQTRPSGISVASASCSVDDTNQDQSEKSGQTAQYGQGEN